MPPIDPSIPLGVKAPEQQNPLTQLGQYATVSNAMAQNKLLDIAQQRGQIGIQSDQTALQQAQQNQATQGMNRTAQQAATLLTLPGGQLTPDRVKAAIQDEVAAGSVPSNVANVWLQNVDKIGGNEQALRSMLTAHLVGTLSGPEAVKTVFGSPMQVSDGANIIGGSQNGVLNPAGGGAINAQTAIPQKLSPGEATAPTQIGVTPQGAPVMGTRQQFLQAAQGSEPINGLTNGRVPSALRGPNAQPQQPAQPGVVTGMGPGQQAAAQTGATASSKAFQDYQDQGIASRQRGAILDNMLGDASAFTSGPGADAILKLRQIGGRLGIPVDTNATTAAESFNKLSAQIAAQQGAGSDARLAVSQQANPHADPTSPGGVDYILRQLRGNEDYIQARANLAAKYPDKTDREGFESKTGAQLDPRTFQYDRMTPPQKTQFFNSLGDDKARRAFIKSHTAAQALLSGQ